MTLVTILNVKTQKQIDLIKVDSECTIAELKELFHERNKTRISRQSYKANKMGRALPDDSKVAQFISENQVTLFFKDLGPQVAWGTVFLLEYFGPPIIYGLFYLLNDNSYTGSFASETKLVCTCTFVLHYVKRLYETMFVHRFSHATMPIFSLFKNCTYYWGFAAFIAHCNTHVQYTPPYFGRVQLYAGLACFLISETGNFFIHTTLRDLRPVGSKERRIPLATGNVFTHLFNLVSCPNYFYEYLTWISFSVASQSLPSLIFAAVGFAQMASWAVKKHRAYRKNFSNYPRQRKAIIPFIL